MAVDVMDLATTVVTLNNHRIQGWGDSNEVLRLPEIDLLTERVGADGKAEAIGMGSYGGEVMIDILPTAPSARVLEGWLAQGQAGRHRSFEGSVQRPDGSLTYLRDGFLKRGKPGPNQGNGAAGLLTFTFYFQIVRPDYDATSHNAVPTLPSASLIGVGGGNQPQAI